MVSGARRKVEDWNPEEAANEAVLGEEQREEMRQDPIKRLEHLQKDKARCLMFYCSSSDHI